MLEVEPVGFSVLEMEPVGFSVLEWSRWLLGSRGGKSLSALSLGPQILGPLSGPQVPRSSVLAWYSELSVVQWPPASRGE